VGEIVAFNVAVEDPDGDALNVAWDFGDGNTSTALTPTHAYAASGIYNAAVSVSDGAASVSASILVAVSADAESVGSNDELKVQKFMLKLSFSKTGKDSMALSGTVPVEIDSPTDGRFFILAVGDLFYDLDLDAKGKAKIGNVSIKVAGKVKADRYLASPLKFSFSVKNAALRDDLADLGFIDKNTSSAGETVNFSIAVIFDEVVYLNELSAVYKAKARKTGSAKR
jgi:PKD repeat protein